jgi:Uma2 family endonuclease
MSATLNISAPESVVVHFEPSKLRMTRAEFYEFCKLNPDLRIERTSEGDLIVMAPTGGKTGGRNFILIGAMDRWVRSNQTGKGFDEEYIANGAELGWLIDPLERKVHVYRPGVAVEVLDDPETVSGDPLLKGFVLDVREIWD